MELLVQLEATCRQVGIGEIQGGIGSRLVIIGLAELLHSCREARRVDSSHAIGLHIIGQHIGIDGQFQTPLLKTRIGGRKSLGISGPGDLEGSVLGNWSAL